MNKLRKILSFVTISVLLIMITFMFSACSLLDTIVEGIFGGGSQTNNSSQDDDYYHNNNDTTNSPIDSNNQQSQPRKVTIYKNSSEDYKPTGTIDEQLITSKLLIDLSGVLGTNFKGNVKLDFMVDLAYKNDYTSPTPTFTFYYYTKNEINSDYLLGQNTVYVLSKQKKTYSFSLTVYLEGSIIYGALSCNYDMGYDGNNILGMYLDYRTYSLNNYFVTVTKL